MKQRFSQHMRYYERSLILILMLFSASVMQAQNRTVKGTVSDAQGEPIIGANVVIVGGTKGVITDLDGKYSIQVPENGAVLKFSYIGFKTKSFNPFNNKHFLEPLHHLLTTKIFIFFPSHSHTLTLSIVIERRYTFSHHN